MEKKIPMIAVAGPTATGKTALGVGIAERFGGEIISCDSMQVYRGLPIGTAQPAQEELNRVPHHLVSFLDVWESFSVSDYVNLAKEAAASIYAGGKLPVLVGGTGLYVRSLLRGFSFEENGRSEELRRELAARGEREGFDTLYRELQKLDPVGAREIHPNNIKRVVRALEYCKLEGEPFSAQAERSRLGEPPYNAILFCLSFRDRQKLYSRIDSRVDDMLEAGLLEEAERFYRFCRDCDTLPTAAQAIGYKELFPFFEGKASLQEAVENIKQESRRYAKRQLTWFSREPDARFLYVDEWDGFAPLLQECVRIIDESGLAKEVPSCE